MTMTLERSFAMNAFLEPASTDILTVNPVRRNADLYKSAAGVRAALNRMDISARSSTQIKDLLAAVLEAFLVFYFRINDAKAADKVQLDALLVDLERIVANINVIIDSDELRADDGSYESIMKQISNAYNTLTTFLKQNAQELRNYAAHTRQFYAYRGTLLDLSDKLFFAHDREIGGILRNLEDTLLMTSNDNQM